MSYDTQIEEMLTQAARKDYGNSTVSPSTLFLVLTILESTSSLVKGVTISRRGDVDMIKEGIGNTCLMAALIAEHKGGLIHFNPGTIWYRIAMRDELYSATLDALGMISKSIKNGNTEDLITALDSLIVNMANWALTEEVSFIDCIRKACGVEQKDVPELSDA